MERSVETLLSNIRKLREVRSYSQDYMASKLGLKQAGYALIEQGKRKLDYSLLLQIAIIFNLDIVDIITFDDEEKRSLSQNNNIKLHIELDLTEKEFVELGLKSKIIKKIK